MSCAVIQEWAVVSGEFSAYDAPETLCLYIRGKVFNSEKFDDGTVIVTSEILSLKENGRIVLTSNNVEYRLGKISKEYRKWLKNNHPKWNHKKPINII
jgi:hypothetical protein